MNRAIVAAIAFLLVLFRIGGAENIEGEVHTETANYGRSVNLGIYYIYDHLWEDMRSSVHVTISPEEYLRLTTQMAQQAHFGNVTCTNMSLVFLGSQQLNESYGVEKIAGYKLDAEATLESFRNYSFIHKDDFGNPDLTVLVTATAITNRSDFCLGKENTSDTTISRDLLEKAYCKGSYGASYFGGMCGRNSVAIIRGNARNFDEASELSRQILNLMGVLSDVLRNEPECNDPKKYVSSTGWMKSGDLKYPWLSSCAVKELVTYIDSMSNSSDKCWGDVPNATTAEFNLTTENLFDEVNLCTWTNIPDVIKCPIRNASENADAKCRMPCCYRDTNESHYAMHYPGKSCGLNGVCFWKKCLQ